MKKAKVFLTAITVFAVVGGALAFKAEKVNGNLFCTTDRGAVCDISTTYKVTTDQTNGSNLFCSNIANGANGCKTQTSTQLLIADQ